MKSSAPTVVIGAGLAGLSAAYHLALENLCPVFVLEREPHPAAHASGRNAGMIRQAVEDPMLARLAREGREMLERAAEEPVWKGLFDGRGGSLFLAGKNTAPQLDAIENACTATGVGMRRVNAAEAAALSPLLTGATFNQALHCPSDAIVDIGVLARGFVTALKRMKVRVAYNRPIDRIRHVSDGFEIQSGKTRFRASRVINAAGAWAGDVARAAEASPVPLKAYRRHLYVAADGPRSSPSWPYVWDLEREVYFRPFGKTLLLSPCDKKLFPATSRHAITAEIPDPAVAPELLAKLRSLRPDFPVKRLKEAKAALRTMTPDGRFVIGDDPRLHGFTWAAGYGGHGVTCSFSAGRMAARLSLGLPCDPELVKAFSPGRFAVKKVYTHAS